MSNFANIIFPQNVPQTGIANRAPQTVAPVVGQANRTPQYTAPAVVQPVNYAGTTVATQEVGQAKHNPNPFNTQVPPIGIPAHTPLSTPIGVYPQFETPTEVWEWDYGNGGGNDNLSGPH